jgi:hypothetical protein
MGQGFAIHIGSPDGGAGCCTDDHLDGPAGDVETMREIAAAEGFETAGVLVGPSARWEVLKPMLEDFALLKRGDILLVTYSGHGCQKRDQQPSDERDGYDETWCLADREVRDDDLYSCWTNFAAGVRILVISDGCHSGSPSRRLLERRQEGSAPSTYRPRRSREEELADIAEALNIPPVFRPALLPRRASLEPITASLLLLAACSEDQKARDGNPNSLFTGKLKQVWKGGRFSGYLDFLTEIRNRVSLDNRKQYPGCYVLGQDTDAFLRQRPFAIG